MCVLGIGGHVYQQYILLSWHAIQADHIWEVFQLYGYILQGSMGCIIL